VAASGNQSLARPAGRQAAIPRERPDPLASGWLALIPGLITLLVTMDRVGVPSFTRDEGATLLSVHRSFPEMLRMLGNVDVVHTAYYALIWVVTRLAGSSELAVRAPSAVAMAVTAAGVTLLGQRLASGRAGLAAGLLLAAFPSVSYYAEDAREYAIVAALATVSGYLLVRALQAATPPKADDAAPPSPGPRSTAPGAMEARRPGGPASEAAGTHQPTAPRPGDEGTGRGATEGVQEGRPPRPAGYGWLAGYAAAVVLLGLSNILSLLIIVAHAVTIAVWRRSYGGPERPFVRRWLVSAAIALVVASPVVAIATRQTHQVQWIKVPGLAAIADMATLVGPRPVFLIVVAIIAIALAAAGLTGGRARLRADWPPGLWGLAVPWLVLPPALLFGVSVIHVIHPLYAFRYIAFCIPAVALLAGAALAALARSTVGWGVAIAALAVIVFAGLPTQSTQRTQAGHGYAIRAADRAVARLSRPGDALLNVRYWPPTWGGGVERGLAGEYPYGLGRLHDISQAQAPVPSATLGGTFAPDSVVRQRLEAVTRLWVASWSEEPSALPPRLGFTLARTLHTRGVWLWLYTRPHAAAAVRTNRAATSRTVDRHRGAHATPWNFAPPPKHSYRARLCPLAAHRSYSNLGGPPGSGCWLARKTSRVGKVLGGLGVLLVAGTVAGCAAPQYTYVSDTSAYAYFKVPYGWHRISDVSLAAQFKTPGSALGQNGTWDIAYDAAPAPTAVHLFSPSAAKPFAFAFVAPLNSSASQSLSDNGLRDVLLPVTSEARLTAAQGGRFPLTHFRLLRDAIIKPGPEVHGVWDTYSYTYPGGTTDTFDQVALTNADKTQLYVLMVHCMATCYTQNHDQIDTIMSSFTVRSP